MLEQSHQESIVSVELGKMSAVRSHHSYDPDVHGLCHHSGQYLGAREIGPRWVSWLIEPREFPGLRRLDAIYRRAVHARGYRHWVWSAAGVSGVCALISAICLLGLTAWMSRYRDQVGGAAEQTLFRAMIGVGIGGGLAFALAGALLIMWRSVLYHRKAAGLRPATADFPLIQPMYELIARERITRDLGNAAQPDGAAAARQECGLSVRVYPNEESQALYLDYMRLYGRYGLGGTLYGGAVSLEGLQSIMFDDATRAQLAYGHRMELRGNTPARLAAGVYQGDDGPLITRDIAYSIRSRDLYGYSDERRRYPLECHPQIAAYDSYTIELRFRWLGDQDLTCLLNECRLWVPPELVSAEGVAPGRYDAQRQEVIWSNLVFQRRHGDAGAPIDWLTRYDDQAARADGREQELVLRVSFSSPILQHEPVLTGSYRCSLDGLISGMQLRSDRIWTAYGRSVADEPRERAPLIQTTSVLEGNLTISTRGLLQDHEHVRYSRIQCRPINARQLLEQVLDRMVEQGVDLQRIEQAAPRNDPLGSAHDQLYYWDITGCWYSANTLNAIDVHAVISGYGQLTQDYEHPIHAQIDLRVRCLHDPRMPDMSHRADTLLKALEVALQGGVGAPAVTERFDDRAPVVELEKSVNNDGIERRD